jgi:hypothetical protein
MRESDRDFGQRHLKTIDHPVTSLGPRVKNRAAPSVIFFQKTENDLMLTTLARVRRLDCRGEGLPVRGEAGARLDPKAKHRLLVFTQAKLHLVSSYYGQSD